MKRFPEALSYLAFLGVCILGAWYAHLPVAHAQMQQFGQPVTLGSGAGMTPLVVNAITNSIQTVSSTPGALGSYFCNNPNSVPEYVQIYDAVSPTQGSTRPKWSMGIPATGAANLGLPLGGINFTTAITVSAATSVLGSTAPTTALDCSFGYRN